jgi:PPK2 family polyphosphate:nucleotide phosphotransferase
MILPFISASAPDGLEKQDTVQKTKELIDRIGYLHKVLVAERKHALLVVFQGMDASGKDGVVSSVFEECSPVGMSAHSFKKPTEEEFAHDFLWRVHKLAPQKGNLQIFVRSHYEDVLIQRVHGWIDEERALKRINSINAFEELLQYDNNTTIVKFYMHLSREEQRKQLQERLDEPEKYWKHNDNDWKEAELWDDYMRCYEDIFARCTIPWHICPCDQRWYRDYFVAKKMVETLESLDMKLPGLVTNMEH